MTASIKELAPNDRPRERLEAEGAAALSNSELVAIILNSGTRNENAIAVAQELLGKEKLARLPGLGVRKLCESKGIGKAKACRLIAAVELGKRALSAPAEGAVIKSAADAVGVALPSLANRKKEVFVGLYIGTKNRLLKKEVISIGSVDKTVVHAREVFKPAIEESASGVVLLHNHPSGDPSPSEEDIELTKELGAAGELIGIELLDHIIVGKNSYASTRESGII
ncbi:MAG: DNA repair protein RadC [Candidatus Diapherotrites archaeon]|nr:DNA repair protein RadC [Candidatus Diapherotrites archaeon]